MTKLPNSLPARYAAGDVTYRPSLTGKGFDVIHPDGIDWTLTEDSALSTIRMYTEGLRREDHTASEWRYIVTGKR